ncbi:XK-related protein 6-like isoform X2 [Haliotis rubra]|uniref:XK-related protein 6-like isoform X2 n=1 Tax=Haliotis rubra TaxID=36100 RepID=UPI001EE6110F|nr:XK-related protein 6-like isoform X2 [Haliotis rubra]
MESPDRSEDVMVMSNIPFSSRSGSVTPYTYLFGPDQRDGETHISEDVVDIGMEPCEFPIERIAAEPEHEERFTPKFGKLEAFFGFLAIGFYVSDVGTDIWMAVKYFMGGQLLHGSVTVVLIVVPSLVMCGLGLTWYVLDYQKEQMALVEAKHDTDPCMLGRVRELLTPAYLWPIRFTVTLLQFGMIIRISEYLNSVFKFMHTNTKENEEKKEGHKRKKIYYWRAMCQDVNVCLLQLFESFLESVPQLTWQLYVWITLKPEEDVLGCKHGESMHLYFSSSRFRHGI